MTRTGSVVRNDADDPARSAKVASAFQPRQQGVGDEGQVHPTACVMHIWRKSAPDRLDRHPVTRFVQQVQAARRGVMPQRELNHLTHHRHAQIDGIPMRERRPAHQVGTRVVLDRQNHRHGPLGAMDDPRIRHIGRTFRPSRRPDDNGSTELPDHPNPPKVATNQQRET